MRTDPGYVVRRGLLFYSKLLFSATHWLGSCSRHFKKKLAQYLDVTKIRVQIYGHFNQQGLNWLAGNDSVEHDVSSLKVSSLLNYIYHNDFELRDTIQNSAGNILDIALVPLPIYFILSIADP